MLKSLFYQFGLDKNATETVTMEVNFIYEDKKYPSTRVYVSQEILPWILWRRLNIWAAKSCKINLPLEEQNRTPRLTQQKQPFSRTILCCSIFAFLTKPGCFKKRGPQTKSLLAKVDNDQNFDVNQLCKQSIDQKFWLDTNLFWMLMY